MGHKQMVIGGDDFTLTELLTWHPAHLAGLILKYQETRKWWQRADSSVATYVAALESELRATQRELEGAKVELRLRRNAAKVRAERRAA
jgi:hypothetical protein